MAIKTALKQIHIIINTLIIKANAAIDKLFYFIIFNCYYFVHTE